MIGMCRGASEFSDVVVGIWGAFGVPKLPPTAKGAPPNGVLVLPPARRQFTLVPLQHLNRSTTQLLSH